MFLSFLRSAWDMLLIKPLAAEEKILTVLLEERELSASKIEVKVEKKFGAKIGMGRLYPALLKLESEGAISSRWSYPLNQYALRPRGRVYKANR